MPRAAVRLVKILNCLAYDWAVKEGWKVRW